MADKDAEKYFNYAELAMQDKDYADARKYILMSLNLKISQKGYKLLADCDAKLQKAGNKSDEQQPNGHSNVQDLPTDVSLLHDFLERFSKHSGKRGGSSSG